MSESTTGASALRLTTLSSGMTHHGRRVAGAYFILCRQFSVTPSWLPGARSASGVVVGLDGGAPVTCRRCLRLAAANKSVDLMVQLRASVDAAKKRRMA